MEFEYGLSVKDSTNDQFYYFYAKNQAGKYVIIENYEYDIEYEKDIINSRVLQQLENI